MREHHAPACNRQQQAPINGLMLNSDSWLGVIRRVGMNLLLSL